MVSPLAKSMALASVFAPRATLAFTASPSVGFGASSAAPPRSSKTALRASVADDKPRRRPSLSSSQDERLDGIVGDIGDVAGDLSPRPSSPLGGGDDDDGPRSSEFDDLEPLVLSPARQSRLEAEARISDTYISPGSDGYWDLRDEITRLEGDLRSALDAEVGEGAVGDIRRMLWRAQAKDPDHVYRVTSEAARSAERAGEWAQAERYSAESARAKRMLPQFNLEGLWVGKYGSDFEMINVTYSDSSDQLTAYKVTGDKTIPRGEVSFTVDLSPETNKGIRGIQDGNKLDPIILSEESSKKWGTRRLPRFPGRGHVSEPGFVNHQHLEGQLVVVGMDYFSFVWVPLEQQIFFGRPTPELVLKMLREGGGAAYASGTGPGAPGPGAGVREMAEYAERCLEVTADAAWEGALEGRSDPFGCIWCGDEAEERHFE